MMNNNKVIKLLAGFFLICLTSFGQANNVRSFYLKDIHVWLGNTTTENAILNYAQGNAFNYIIFYDLGSLNWSSSTVKNNLAAFLSRARANFGITQFAKSFRNSLEGGDLSGLFVILLLDFFP